MIKITYLCQDRNRMAIRRDKKSFLDKIQEHARSILEKEDRMYLYGSRARGDNNDSSDWDIMIITSKTHSEDDSFEKYTYPLVLFGQINSQDVSVITYSLQEWENRKGLPFYGNVMEDRKRII